MKKFLSIFLSCYLVNLNAQWIALPTPINPYSFPGPSCNVYFYLPDVIMPVGNGKIIYTTACGISSSTGGEVEFQYSTADLSNTQNRASFGPAFGCCPNWGFYSENDSCFSFIFAQAGITWVRYTTNKFTNQAFLYNVGSPGMAKATCITPNLVYCVGQNGSSDSLRFFRSTKTGSSLVKTTNYTFDYLSSKLQFVNDSTGFTLATFKSNSAKTVLLKTIDYGATWTPVHTDSTNNITDYHIMASGVGYLCKKLGDTYYSNDFGNTWTYKGIPPASNYYAIRFMNDSCGYIGGNSGSLFKTINRGINWTFETSNTTQNINTIYAFGNIAYFLDASKKVFKNSALSVMMFKSTNFIPVSTMSCTQQSVSTTFTMSSPAAGMYSISVQSPPGPCVGSTSIVTSNTSFGYTFTCPGTYTLTAYDGASNLLGVLTHSVFINPSPGSFSPTITAIPDTVCIGDPSIISFTPTTTSTYTISSVTWNNSSTGPSMTVTPSADTWYYITSGVFTTPTRTCNVNGGLYVRVVSCVGINELSSFSAIRIYPNPVSGVLFISTQTNKFENSKIEISNVIGKVVLEDDFKTQLDVSLLPFGYYNLKIRTSSKEEFHFRFIKE